jgi:hypothetical protein
LLAARCAAACGQQSAAFSRAGYLQIGNLLYVHGHDLAEFSACESMMRHLDAYSMLRAALPVNPQAAFWRARRMGCRGIGRPKDSCAKRD